MPAKSITSRGRKIHRSITLNKYLLDKANKLVEAGLFGSVSDVVNIAMTEFFAGSDTLLQIPNLKKVLAHPEMKHAVIIDHRGHKAEPTEKIRKSVGIPEPPEPGVVKG